MRGALFACVAVLMGGETAAAEHVVTMAEGEYRPAELTVQVGDTVRFINEDAVDHAVFAPAIGHAFDLGRQKPDEERVYRFGKAGVIEIECVNHGDMLLTVEVVR